MNVRSSIGNGVNEKDDKRLKVFMQNSMKSNISNSPDDKVSVKGVKFLEEP